MSKPIPVPYRLCSTDFCKYENAADRTVFFGDRVTICMCLGPDGVECETTGELYEVTYGADGFIREVNILDEKGDGHLCAFPCEGVFYVPEGEEGGGNGNA